MSLPSGEAEDERTAYVALASIPRLTAAHLDAIIVAHGSALRAITPPAADDNAFLPAALRRRVERTGLEQGRAIREQAAACGSQVLLPHDADFPRRLLEIPDPPRMLFARGRVELLRHPAVAIVGSREHSRYGVEACRLAVEAAVGAGAVVVSGMARGIDAHVHRHTLHLRGGTIGVLGNGIDVVYPRSNRDLYGHMAAEGLLVTEHAPGVAPMAYHFPWRNRLIAGLSHVTVVVEGTPISGAMTTAMRALEQGGEVLAVPGPITSVHSHGCNLLLRDGAAPFLEPKDLWDRLPHPPGFAPVMPASGPVPILPDDLSPLEERVARLVAAHQPDVDVLAHGASVSPAEALATLLALEIRGLVEPLAGRRYRLRAV